MKTEHKLIWWLKYYMNSIIYFCLHKYNRKMSELPNGSLNNNWRSVVGVNISLIQSVGMIYLKVI